MKIANLKTEIKRELAEWIKPKKTFRYSPAEQLIWYNPTSGCLSNSGIRLCGYTARNLFTLLEKLLRKDAEHTALSFFFLN